ncbi:MAG: carboxypeptidase-like regulatory domain-containing protein, partial [Edaphobacter sp.]
MSETVRPPCFAVSQYLVAALLSISLLFLPCTAAAQVSGAGAISGTVTDSTGAVIPGATVTTTNTSTSVSLVRKSTSTGYYVVSPLQPGSYSMVVSSPGFQDLKQENVTVNALQTLSFNPKLAIGNATETVTVSTAPPALQTSNATLGAVMENKTYSELPLLMSQAPRDPTAFVQLMPGVSAGGRAGIFGGVGSGNMNEMYIEGVPLTTVDSQGDNRKINQNLSVDAVDQFQVQTSGSSAQYQGIGVENFSVKQGSNTFHGNASDFIRNTAFDSWGFLQKSIKIHNADGSTNFAPKPPEHQNELSASLSGPIHKDRIFFFVNYDRYHYNAVSSPSLQTIPTTDFRQGDFSAL